MLSETGTCITSISQLDKFSTIAKQIRGSLAVGMLLSSAEMQKHLLSILHVFHRNASSLFPDKIEGLSTVEWINEHTFRLIVMPIRGSKLRKKLGAHSHLYPITRNPKLERLPIYLEDLASSFLSLRTCLDEFSDVKEESLNKSISIVTADLKVRSKYDHVGFL